MQRPSRTADERSDRPQRHHEHGEQRQAADQARLHVVADGQAEDRQLPLRPRGRGTPGQLRRMIGVDWPGPTPKARLAGSVFEVSPASIDIPRKPHEESTRSSRPVAQPGGGVSQHARHCQEHRGHRQELAEAERAEPTRNFPTHKASTAAMIANVEPDRDRATSKNPPADAPRRPLPAPPSEPLRPSRVEEEDPSAGRAKGRATPPSPTARGRGRKAA